MAKPSIEVVGNWDGNSLLIVVCRESPSLLHNGSPDTIVAMAVKAVSGRRTEAAYYCACGSLMAMSGRRRGEREREIYISPWLQVRVTGPRHHLASSLLN